MTLDTHIDSARERVQDEQESIQHKQRALKQFISRTQELSPGSSVTPTAPATPVAMSTGGTQLSGTSGQTESGCSRVRTAFADTVHDAVDGGESVLETLREELSEPIAVAVAPTTDASLTPDLKTAIVAEARNRADELRTLDAALERERAQLTTARETVTAVTDWIVAVNDTPLSELGFESLQERYETLAEHLARCDQLLYARQDFLHGTTSRDAAVGITHRSVIAYLYEGLPVTHPVLATVVRLVDVCQDCQQTVCDHLLRRV